MISIQDLQEEVAAGLNLAQIYAIAKRQQIKQTPIWAMPPHPPPTPLLSPIKELRYQKEMRNIENMVGEYTMDKEKQRKLLDWYSEYRMVCLGICLTPWIEKIRKDECTFEDIPVQNLRLTKSLPAYLRKF